MPRTTTSPTAVSVVVTAAIVVGVLLLGPFPQLEPVRRMVGLGHERLLPAPEVVRRGGAFRFAATQPGSSDPVGWDPCEKVGYEVNPAGMPEGARPMLERAIARISAATGLEFDDEGETDRRPLTSTINLFGGQRPVVIGFGDDREYPELAGAVAGIGGAAPRDGRGLTYYVTGSVVLDTEVFTAETIAQHPRVAEAIVVHELAHVVGLDHVSEPMELMFADNAGQVELGPGDREGLARVGSLPCG